MEQNFTITKDSDMLQMYRTQSKT